jgi:hypothetical protein
MFPKILSLLGLAVEAGSKLWDLYVRIRKLKSGRKPEI